MGVRAIRFWSVLIVMAMLISILPTVSFAAKPNDLVTENGVLMVEAEELKYERSVFTKAKNNEMFSGKYALQVITCDKENTDPELEADIDLSFKADVDGRYSVWVRATATASSGDSVYLSLNQAKYEYKALSGQPEVPNWANLVTVPLKAGASADIRIRARQMGNLNLDVFYITNDDAFSPTDAKLGMDNLIGYKPRPTPTPNVLDPEKQYVVLEAEKMDFDDAQFKIVEDSGASNSKVLSPANDNKTVPGKEDTAGLDLSFVAPTGGSYYVWGLAQTCGDSAGNSVFLSKGQGGSYAYFAINGTPEKYEWTKFATVPVLKDEIGYVRVNRRQGSAMIKIDKFVITNDPAFMPVNRDDIPGATGDMKLPDDMYKKPPVSPKKGEHPRLWLHKEDIPKIKANMEKEQNANAVAAQKKYLERSVSIASKYSSDTMLSIEAKAFDYVLNGNKESGRKAYDLYMDVIAIADYTGDSFEVREYGHLIYTGAKVYDWCYDILTEDEKKEICKAIEARCYSLSGGYPPKPQSGYITGHNSEGIRLSQMVSFAIAAYDERPDIWNCIGGLLFEKYVPVRDFYYQSHSYHQGSGYVNARFGWDMQNAVMMSKSLHIDPYNMEDMNQVPYEQIYNRRPDGQCIRLGDDYNEYNNKNFSWWGYDNMTMFLASNYFGDEYLKNANMLSDPFFEYVASGNQGEMSPAVFLIVNDPDLKGKDYDDLPLTKYYPSPNGAMTARTGWNFGYDSDDVLAYMKIGELYGANHAHLDMGSFQLYYKGILATDSGYYTTYGDEHHSKYQKAGIAHNIVTVFDPTEPTGTFYNDGGYRWPSNGNECSEFSAWTAGEYTVAEVMAHEFGPDTYKPEYSYVAGDLTKAYSDKVKESLRSMVFMPLDDPDHPGALVVMDKVTSKDKSFAKNWLLHTEEEPVVEGNKTIVKRVEDGGNGRMVNETLLPKEADIEIIGGEGKQFWNGMKNVAIDGRKVDEAAEIGWGRVEVGPKSENETDYFLNVMTVSDADTTAPDIESTLIEGDKIAGAVFADRAVVFNKNKERISDSISFTLPEGERKLFAAGLKAGTWSVNGTEAVASEEGGCIYAVVDGGEVTVSYVNENADKTFTANKPENNDKTINIKVNGMYIYSDVKPVIIDDRTLVPMRAIFEKLDADVTWDEATATATAKNPQTTVKITENSKTAYVNDQAVELDVPAMILDGRFVVPIRFVSESMGARVNWSNASEMVDIKYTKPAPVIDYTPTQKNAIKVAAYSSPNAEEDNGIDKSLDGDIETRWAIQGSDFEAAYGIYDLGAEYVLDKMLICAWKSDQRRTLFMLDLSSDGENWKQFNGDTKDDGVNKLGVFKTNGINADGDPEAFDLKGEKARYIRIRFGGTTQGDWVSILETTFIEKK